MASQIVRVRGAVGVVLVHLLYGCANVSPVLTPPTVTRQAVLAEFAFEQEAALNRLRDQESRLAAVVFRLAAGGVGLCPKTGPASGLVLHHIDQYGIGTRPYAQKWFQLDENPAVLAVVRGSPADVAGLKAGDSIVSVNNHEFDRAPGAPSKSGSYAALDNALGLLDRELALGPATLSVKRGGAEIHVKLSAVNQCRKNVQLEVSSEVNASADSTRVFVTTAMVRYAGSDDELAVFVAHELAHVFLGHQERIARSGPSGALLGNLGAAGEGLRGLEAEADYLGLYLVARAGYDVGAAEPLWRQFGADFPDIRNKHWSHPGSLERIAAIRKTTSEIAGKMLLAAPISPEGIERFISVSGSDSP